jgi:hypothetical protein
LTSEKISHSQIPDLVYEYINSEIAQPNGSNPAVCINKCLYAFAQCFNLNYANTIKEYGPKMVECRYYRKGYTCSFGGLTFVTKVTDKQRDEMLNTKLEYEISKDKNGVLTYKDVYVDENNLATIFDYLMDKKLYYPETPNPPKSIDLIEVKDLLKLRRIDTYNYLSELKIDFNKEDIFKFENDGSAKVVDIVSYSTLGNKIPKLKEFCDIALCSSTIVELTKKKINNVDVFKPFPTETNTNYKTQYNFYIRNVPATSISYLINGEDNPEAIFLEENEGYALGFGTFRKCRPTWCNVFARYLASKYFTQEVVPDKRANDIHKYFCENSINNGGGNRAYVQIDKDDKLIIWSDYVNRGFPVYFTISANGHGHIETGFPANMLPTSEYYNYKENSGKNTSCINPQSYDLMSIGAGGMLGYKNYEGYKDVFFDQKTFKATRIFKRMRR